MNGLLFDNAEDVVLAHHQILFAFDLDLGAGVLAEEDPVAYLDVHPQHLAVLGHLPLADGDDLALLGFLLGGVGDDEASGGLGLFLDPFDDDAIMQRSDVHGSALLS